MTLRLKIMPIKKRYRVREFIIKYLGKRRIFLTFVKIDAR